MRNENEETPLTEKLMIITFNKKLNNTPLAPLKRGTENC
jgi:hypothetical protein